MYPECSDNIVYSGAQTRGMGAGGKTLHIQLSMVLNDGGREGGGRIEVVWEWDVKSLETPFQV